MPAVMNAANEVAVKQFLQRKIVFGMIPEIIEKVMDGHAVTHKPPHQGDPGRRRRCPRKSAADRGHHGTASGTQTQITRGNREDL